MSLQHLAGSPSGLPRGCLAGDMWTHKAQKQRVISGGVCSVVSTFTG